MATRCLDCHTDVRDQLDAQRPLHGLLSDGMQCRRCHTEHKGAHGVLTNLAHFDHDCAAFKLTGKHKTVACASCHVNHVYKGTAHQCASCHAEPQVHRGRFGTDCAQCHTTSTWEDATFTHSFPLNHGRGKRGASACFTCHTTPNDYQTYTCYGCHRHDPVKTEEKHLKKGLANAANVRNCAECHPTGRKHRRLQARKDEPMLELCPGSRKACDLFLAQEHPMSCGYELDECLLQEPGLQGHTIEEAQSTARHIPQAPGYSRLNKPRQVAANPLGAGQFGRSAGAAGELGGRVETIIPRERRQVVLPDLFENALPGWSFELFRERSRPGVN
jgi:hypothetical protein